MFLIDFFLFFVRHKYYEYKLCFIILSLKYRAFGELVIYFWIVTNVPVCGSTSYANISHCIHHFRSFSCIKVSD